MATTQDILASRRARVVKLAHEQKRPLSRFQRIFLEEPSHCTAHERSIEFAIKRSISDYFAVPYRSVVFTGSGHLGFSPHKGTLFDPRTSDLDVAIIDITLYQEYYELCIEHSRAFTDLTGYTYRGGAKSANLLQEYIARKGMIPLWKMPSCETVLEDEAYLAGLGEKYRHVFAGISVVLFISEYAFCWKQASAVKQLMATYNV